MTLSTTKTSGDTITDVEWNEAATAANKVTDSTLAASDITSGTFATGRISEVSVTQHEGALTLTESQISDLGSYIANVVDDTTPQLGGNLDLNSQTLTGNGGLNFTGNIDVTGLITASGDVAVNTNTFFVDVSTDRVGVGTVSPARTLHVNSGNVNNCLRLESTDSTTTLEMTDDTTSNQSTLKRTGDLLVLAADGGEVQVEDTMGAVSEVNDGNSSTADTIDFGVGNYHKSTMTGNCTYTFTAPTGPARLQLKLVQDATGSRTATWPAAVKWAGGTAPTLTTTASATDIITFYYDGTNYYGSSLLDVQ